MGVSGSRFPRRARLTRQCEFQRVFDHGRRLPAGPLLLIYAANGLDHPRLGLAVPKRRVRLAVARNRLKRMIRESFRRHWQALPAVDIVVLARSGSDTPEPAALREHLDQAWREVSRRCAGS